MLNLTRTNFNSIKNKLLRQKQKVEGELRELDKKDPVMLDGLAESSEPGTESWMADVHNQVVAVKQNLHALLSKIKKSLVNLKTGKYGKCEVCGKIIERARLEAMPTATDCLSCSKKAFK
ncbi:TraR/DksA C4-type zinc finger protein [Candidatus Daviesbacteria bacterium]|nr:TraR/DksA C4-type zinc finger protein [Candidatus Daviesbacteria bacterium]